MPSLASSLAIRVCPQAGCSTASSMMRRSIVSATRFFGFGTRRDISISAASPPFWYKSLNR